MCMIVYVEPDDVVRSATAHHLEQAGHTVLAYPSAHRARPAALTQPRLLLLDSVLADGRASDLIEHFEKHALELSVLVTFSTWNATALRYGAIQKPFTLDALAQRIGQLTDAPALPAA
ncbi:MAG: hypothetical protein ACXU8N_12555 [Telluria sp.]